MAYATTTGLASVPPVLRAQFRQAQQMMDRFDARLWDDFVTAAPTHVELTDSARTAHQAMLRSIQQHVIELDRSSTIDRWWIVLEPDSIEGLELLLAGLRNALRAALNIGSYLRQLATNRDRHGLAPGKIVTIHPQVTRGPDARRSTCRSSADLVMT